VPTIPASDLTEFATDLLAAVGVAPDEATVVGTSLVGANLRGHDSHGVMRLPQYIGFIEQGQYRHGVELKVERETPGAVVCDGQWGLGQVQAHRLLDLLIPKAHELGVAVATARDCGHIGRLGEYAERAAGVGLLLVATVNNGGATQRVAPPGGLEPRLSTNPFCAGVPTKDPGAPIVVDFGTSVVAEGKVRDYYISQRRVPEGWLLDHDGQPTTDPSVLYEQPTGTILPLGGAQSYKGFGLGLILDIWAGGLSGGGCSQTRPRGVVGNNVFFLALDPHRLAGTQILTDQAADLANWIRATPRAAGVDRIILPGDPERRIFEERSATGIPLDDSHWARLINLAERLRVCIPGPKGQT
jgi:hydroxycarboxylate dehydrogenase B